ncbi:MAG: hypothetical protein HPY70_11505 [Firmicutes bacterium]|nr:hypothetical protein [Bacillota bacterium]
MKKIFKSSKLIITLSLCLILFASSISAAFASEVEYKYKETNYIHIAKAFKPSTIETIAGILADVLVYRGVPLATLETFLEQTLKSSVYEELEGAYVKEVIYEIYNNGLLVAHKIYLYSYEDPGYETFLNSTYYYEGEKLPFGTEPALIY